MLAGWHVTVPSGFTRPPWLQHRPLSAAGSTVPSGAQHSENGVPPALIFVHASLLSQQGRDTDGSQVAADVAQHFKGAQVPVPPSTSQCGGTWPGDQQHSGSVLQCPPGGLQQNVPSVPEAPPGLGHVPVQHA
jgi:hypothetical protein